MTPKLRFKGFTDDWEQRKVREIANRYDNLRVPVAANLRVSGTTPYYGANGIQDYVEGYTHEGEFVLVAEDGANDLKNYPVKCVNGRIWVNNHAHVLQGKAEIADNQFLAYSINQADIESLLVGGSRAKLNAETLMDLELTLPSLTEQRVIGTYLKRLDNLITLHQRKYERLVNIKKGLTQKIFSQKIRFKDEKGVDFPEWEEKRLWEILAPIVKKPVNTSLYPKITIGLHKKGVSYCVSDRKMSDTRPFYIRREGELIIGKQNFFNGSIALLPKEFDGCICSNAIMSFSFVSECPKFVYEAISNPTYLKERECYANGTGQKELSENVFLSFLLCLPCIKEQQKIADFLSSYDELIAIEKRKLETWKNIKKGFLQQLFV